MKTLALSLIAGWSVFLAGAVAAAQCPHCGGNGFPAPDVASYRCVKAPEVKPVTKTQYDVKTVPFCLPKLAGFLRGCCPLDCDHPRFKRVLMKRDVNVEPICDVKCVVEAVIPPAPAPCPHCSPPSRLPPTWTPLLPPPHPQ